MNTTNHMQTRASTIITAIEAHIAAHLTTQAHFEWQAKDWKKPIGFSIELGKADVYVEISCNDGRIEFWPNMAKTVTSVQVAAQYGQAMSEAAGIAAAVETALRDLDKVGA